MLDLGKGKEKIGRLLLHLLADRTRRRGEHYPDRYGAVADVNVALGYEAKADNVAVEIRVLDLGQRAKDGASVEGHQSLSPATTCESSLTRKRQHSAPC